MSIKKITGALCFLFLLNSCDQFDKKTETPLRLNADEILKVDKAFSDMSRQVGMKKAYLQFMAKEGVLLRPENPPIMGADAIYYLSQVNDEGYTISWEPTRGEIAESRDLGYTFGIYEIGVEDTTIKGTYVHVWKKQADGSWKFIIASGNQGISPTEP